MTTLHAVIDEIADSGHTVVNDAMAGAVVDHRALPYRLAPGPPTFTVLTNDSVVVNLDSLLADNRFGMPVGRSNWDPCAI
ncbi:hypothetical protein [uncultured Mycobacterium sp.]|uniref:hypothetical protein n=1 Tax=uncultured Mycobacterium sp. TaxID=171292 RepID=UPI0035CC9C9F